jgi:hypothetical protein
MAAAIADLFARDSDSDNATSGEDDTPPAIFTNYELHFRGGGTATSVGIRSYGMCYGGSTGMDVWPAAHVLAGLLADETINVRGLTTFEIGAGTGLPSLGAVVGGASVVVASDRDDPWVLSNLRHNLTVQNQHVVVGRAGVGGVAPSISVRPYAWGEKAPPDLAGSCDVVMLCDLIYHTKFHREQLESMAALLRRNGGRGIVAYCVANQSEEDAQGFRTLAEEFGFDCTMVVNVSEGEAVNGGVHVWQLTCRSRR